MMAPGSNSSRPLTTSHGRPEISVLSPVYMGEQSVPELVARICQAVECVTEDYEVVLVEDGSPDGSWRSIEAVCRQDSRVKGIRLSRNFGQTYALTAGLAAVQGRYVIVIDCDLQDDPKYIPDLYCAAQGGYDIVYTRKRQRRHSVVKNVLGGLFYKLFNVLVENRELRSDRLTFGTYSLLSRRVVDAFLAFSEYHRNYVFLLRRLGFDFTYVEVDHHVRPYGKSSYSISKLLRLAIDIIISETNRLLYLSIGAGLAFIAVSLLAAVYVITAYFLHGFSEGWASIIVLILVSTGAILMSLGVTGVYIGKIFEQTKNRPLFLVAERLNFPHEVATEARQLSPGRERLPVVENV